LQYYVVVTYGFTLLGFLYLPSHLFPVGPSGYPSVIKLWKYGCGI